MTSGARRRTHRARRVSPVRSVALLVAAALLATVVGVLALRSPSDGGVAGGAAPVSDAVPPTPPATHPVGRARTVIEQWDAARAAAWSAGDPRALGALYTPGSAAGAADVAMLRAWNARGLRVSDLHLQVLALRTVSAGPARLVLLVTDREVGAVAHRGAQAQPLPGDRPSRHRVTLVQDDGRWRVSSSLAR